MERPKERLHALSFLASSFTHCSFLATKSTEELFLTAYVILPRRSRRGEEARGWAAVLILTKPCEGTMTRECYVNVCFLFLFLLIVAYSPFFTSSPHCCDPRPTPYIRQCFLSVSSSYMLVYFDVNASVTKKCNRKCLMHTPVTVTSVGFCSFLYFP